MSTSIIYRYYPANPEVRIIDRTGFFTNLLMLIPIALFMFAVLVSSVRQSRPISPYLAAAVPAVILLIWLQEISSLVRSSDIAFDEAGVRLIVWEAMVLPFVVTWIKVPAWHICIAWSDLKPMKIYRREVDRRATTVPWDPNPKPKQWSDYIIGFKRGHMMLWCVGIYQRAWSPAFVVTSLHEDHEAILARLRAS